MIVAGERVPGPAWHWKTGQRRVTSEMDTRGYCGDRLDSSGTGHVQSPGRPPAAPHPPRRGRAPAAIPASRHGHDLEHWPLHDMLILAALADAVPTARARLQHVLSRWGHPELSPDASVVVSELVTNSVAASAGLPLATAPVLVWLGSDRRCLLLAVADASSRPPVRLNPGADAERGRGLALVEALSSRWGWHPVSITGLRKVTWAAWHLPPGTSQRPAAGRAAAMPSDQREQRAPPGPGPLETAIIRVMRQADDRPRRGGRQCKDHPCPTLAAAMTSAG
jgi:hypothetical protein